MQLLVRDMRMRMGMDFATLSMGMLVHVRVRARRVPSQLDVVHVRAVRQLLVGVLVLRLEFGDPRLLQQLLTDDAVLELLQLGFVGGELGLPGIVCQLLGLVFVRGPDLLLAPR